MKKDVRLAICLVIIILLVILCIYRLLADKEIENEETTKGISGEVTKSAEPTLKPIKNPKDGSDVELKYIHYYMVNLSEMETKETQTAVKKGEKITAELITEYVRDALEDEELELEVKEVIMDGKLCIVDFEDGIIDLVKQQNSDVERLILDAFAMSLVDNLNDVDEVSFRISGKPYETASFKLKDKEGYLGK